MRLTSEVLSNPQTCGFQIQPQDFSTPLTLQTSSSASSFLRKRRHRWGDKILHTHTKKKKTKNIAPSILTPGEARLVGREAFEDAVGGHRERRLLLVFVRIQGFQFDLLPNFERLPVLPCKERKKKHTSVTTRARGFARTPPPNPRTPTCSTHPHPGTHGHPVAVRRGGSVLGFCAWLTDTGDCDRRSACGWLMLTLVQKSRSANVSLWFFPAIHTLTSTRILPPPSRSSVPLVYLYLAVL